MSSNWEDAGRGDPRPKRATPIRNWRQMFDNHRKIPLIALIGAFALLVSAPAFAQTADSSAPPASADAAASDASASSTAAPPEPVTIKNAGKLTPFQMFLDANKVAQTVMVGLALCSLITW